MRNETNSSLHTINTVMMWLFCLTVLILIVPWEVVSTDLAARIESNKICVYFALIIEVSNFITQGIITICNGVMYKKNAKKLQEKIVQAVGELDFAERALLREYVLQRKSVLCLPVNEPTVRNLIDDGVLRVVNTRDENEYRADVIIAKEARPYITYKAIGLTLGKMSEEQISQIMSSRPEYARQKVAETRKAFIGSSALRRSPVIADNSENEAQDTNVAA